MYRFMIKEDLSKYDLSSIEHATIAGEALNPEVFYQFRKATGISLMEGFGQTETALIVANLAGLRPKVGSMGTPVPGFDVEIVETHHRDKQDAPSGTELALADAVQRGGGGDRYIYDRRARGARAPGEIGIHALRGGSVTGMHELHFLGQGEQLTLTHIAEDRALFARGALAAARFLIGRPPGLYGMRDLARKMLESG